MPHAQESTTAALKLHVNDGPLSSDETVQMRLSYPSEPLEALYQRYKSDGYVLVKGLLPREDVLAAREEYFKSLEPTGVMKPGTSAVEGIFNNTAEASDYPGIGAGSIKNSRPGETDKASMFVELALKAHTAQWYCGSLDGAVTGFCSHPKLRDFVAKLTGWEDDTLALRRTLLRNNTPGNNAIGVHYDQSFMRYGEPTAVTAWVPMGDVRIEGGGLIYLENGDALGAQLEREFGERARKAGMDDAQVRDAFNAHMMSSGFLSPNPKEFAAAHGRRWLVSGYEAGDVVFHTPHMVGVSCSAIYNMLN
jgi:hypothetical protein